MASFDQRNKKSLANITNPLEMMKGALSEDVRLPSIVEFAEHPSFLGADRLYPRQKTLLRLMCLETENMTEYDLRVINEWAEMFNPSDEIVKGINPDIWKRVEWLKANGYDHFGEIIAIIGRRGGKNHLGAILLAYQLWKLILLDDPQEYYGVARGKSIVITCIATAEKQAKELQFADLINLISNSKCFAPYIADLRDYSFALTTPADKRQIASLNARGIENQRLIASIRGNVASSNAPASRGKTVFSVVYDEFAHMVDGTDGPRTSHAVYAAINPALMQFGEDALIFIPTSPYCLVPETPVLLEDLTWAPVGSLKVGDKLVGFDEYAPGGKGNGRSWRQAVVTETSIINAPTLKLKTNGPEVVCTGDHLWLTRTSGSPELKWVKTKNLKQGDRIRYIDTWETDKSYDAGYLSGMYDGEGSYSKQGQLGIAQNPGPVLDNLIKILLERGYDLCTHIKEKGRDCIDITINGGPSEKMKLLGSIRPRRLLAKFTSRLYGTRIYDKTSKYVTVESIVDSGNRDVVALGTSTKTLLADGMFSHNTEVGKAHELYKNSIKIDKAGNPEFPTMLTIQLASWDPYEDWDNVEACEGMPFTRRQVPQLYDAKMKALEQRDPETFRVENLSQWAKVTDAFLNPRIVERIFSSFKDSTGIERVLTPQDQGKLGYIYYGHADPSKNNNNFAVMVAHAEEIYDPENNETWTHVIIDHINCYKPEDFPEHQIDYAMIEDDLIDVLDRFRSIRKFTFDQYGSFVTVDSLKKRIRAMRPAHRAMILEEKASLQSNMQRCERFKSAIGMNWVHSFKDQFGDEQTCLLEQELKFLQLKNGKVQKMSFGPVRTEDLADCIMHCVDNLLENNFHKLELRDRLGKTTLGVAAMGGYHSHTPSELAGVGQMSGREKLKSFSSTWRSYNNQGHDPARGRRGRGI
jgi:hypothetical protein